MLRYWPAFLLLTLPAWGQLRFHASLDLSATADFASGDPQPLTEAGLRIAESATFPPGAQLTYDARGNLYAEQGAISFWWRPDEPPGRVGFPLFLASYEQHSTWDFNFLRIDWTGSELRARIRDRNVREHTVSTGRLSITPGQWIHVAATWSESAGLALYLKGAPAGQTPGPLALDARLDQFALLSRAATPHHTSGTENAGSIDEVRIYGAPLTSEAVARLAARRDPGKVQRVGHALEARFGWNASVPTGRNLWVRRIPFLEARDLGKFWFKGIDGKRETTWPMVGHGYLEEGKTYRIRPASEPVNYLRTTGDLDGEIKLGGSSYRRSGSGELHYHRLSTPVSLDSIVVERREGALAELSCLRVEERPVSPDGDWLQVEPATDSQFALRRDPTTFSIWKPGAGTPKLEGRRYHHVLLPSPTDTGISGVRLRLVSQPGTTYYAAVQDPGNDARTLIEFDARAAGQTLDLALAFPPVIAPAGIPVVLTLFSDAPFTLQARLDTAPAVEARPSHVAARLMQIRDSFQMLSEARPWMRIGRGLSLPSLRRELKLVDELFALLEDVRRVDPANATANGYWSWINRSEPPPPYKETKPADDRVPLWAHRQLALLARFRQVVDWWIDRRQIDSGEMGGGLGDDTDMIQNWPAVALLDGPAPKIRRSARKVLEACYAQNLIQSGMNAHRTDALHAYEEGMNAYGPAFLLDYGNPVLFERMMETAGHYERLTGINRAGHRHFRSYLYSATDLVEEGYHAREDIYSHLILHPGLYVAWYNGLPQVTRLLGEFADALVAHWKTEDYPRLAKGIFFSDDRVENRSAPNTETFNLLWGTYMAGGKAEHLHPLRAAITAGDIGRAASVNGNWIHLFERSFLAKALAAEAAARKVHDHNLQTDQQGIVARVLAWQAGNPLSLVEDAQLALLRHMDQNIYLYTEAEQFTDRIWIPTLSVQRERLGGVAHLRNHIWPGHAISWEDTGGTVGALVPEATPTDLKVIAFNTGAQPRSAIMRIWLLEHGDYRLTARDKSGKALADRKLVLKRYSPVELDLPSMREITVEIRQLAKRTPLSKLPDLAVSGEEIAFRNGLEVPVHNIGAAPSSEFRVSVVDSAGKTLAESAQPALEPPLDLRPRVRTVRFPGLQPRAGMRVVVRQASDEVNDWNNEAVVE